MALEHREKKCSGIIDVPLIYGCWYNREAPGKIPKHRSPYESEYS